MVIATRTLMLQREDGALDVLVRIFAPETENAGWRCRYEIDWPEGTRARAAYGVDAVQALQLVMQMICMDLYTSAHHAVRRLSWPQAKGGYGFPAAKNARDLLEGEDRVFDV